jgi:hypothetical protein
MVVHYLRDFAEAFYILFGAYFNVLAAGIVVAGILLAIAWATIPHIVRRA